MGVSQTKAWYRSQIKARLDQRIIQVVLSVCKFQGLGEHDVVHFPRARYDLGLNMYRPCGLHGDVHVAISTDATRRGRYRERLSVVLCDLSGRGLSARIRHNLVARSGVS